MASPSAYSIYRAGTLSVRKPFAHHYTILGSYTFSKSIDLATDVQLTDSPMDYLNPQLNRALSDNDVRHRFVLTVLGESPGTWNGALRNFKVSMLNTLESPRYYSVFAGFDVNGDGFPFSDRVGTLGRNTYRGDPSYTTDIRAVRVLQLGECLKVEASAEVFNLFDRQNVNGIDTVYGSDVLLGPVPRRFRDVPVGEAEKDHKALVFPQTYLVGAASELDDSSILSTLELRERLRTERTNLLSKIVEGWKMFPPPC